MYLYFKVTLDINANIVYLFLDKQFTNIIVKIQDD